MKESTKDIIALVSLAIGVGMSIACGAMFFYVSLKLTCGVFF